MKWPFRRAKREVKQAEQAVTEAEERQRKAARLVVRARATSRELKRECDKNSWSQLFQESLRGKGEIH